MRVLVTPEWYPWPDAPVFGTFCREQARAVAQHEDVRVLTWRPDPELRAPFRVEVPGDEPVGAFRVHFACSRIPRAGFAFKLAGCVAALARLRGEGWRPDVIHAHEYVAGPVAISLGALTGAPVIFSEHWSGFALGTLDERQRRLARWAFESASLVCPVSRNLAEHVRAVAPRARIEPVPNVVDTETFVPGDGRPAGGPARAISVGSLVEIKGHRVLITALARLRDRGRPMMLDVIGGGPLRPELEALARDLGVDDLVRFHGEVSRADVAAALRHADVFVLPSLWENLPCAALEALSAGLPVVATRVGGVPEVIGPGHGILVEPASPDALAAGLAELTDRIADYDPQRQRAMAVSTYAYGAIARQWGEVYRSVCDVTRNRQRLNIIARAVRR